MKVYGNKKSKQEVKIQNWALETWFGCVLVSLSEGVRAAWGVTGQGKPDISETKSEYGVYFRAITLNNPLLEKLCWFHIWVL